MVMSDNRKRPHPSEGEDLPAKRRRPQENNVSRRLQYGSTYFYAQSGAQDEMFRQASPDATFFVVHQSPGRGYASYKDVDEFLGEYANIPPRERHFYEIIRTDTPLRFYADVEFVVPERRDDEARDRLQALLVHFAAVFEQSLNVVVAASDWVIQDGSRACVLKHNGQSGWKHSYHVNLKRVYFANNETALKTFMTAVRAQLPATDDRLFWTKWVKKGEQWVEKREPIVDFATNTRNRVWRLPLSSKAGDDTPLVPLDASMDLADAFVTVPPCELDRVITEAELATFDEPSRQVAAGSGRRRAAPVRPAVEADGTAATAPESAHPQPAETAHLLRQLTAMLRRHGDLTSQIVREISQPANSPNNTATGNETTETTTRVFAGCNTGERTCPWGHVHDSNNFYLTVSPKTGEVRYHCHASTKSCSGQAVVYGHLERSDDLDLDTTGLHLVEES